MGCICFDAFLIPLSKTLFDQHVFAAQYLIYTLFKYIYLHIGVALFSYKHFNNSLCFTFIFVLYVINEVIILS